MQNTTGQNATGLRIIRLGVGPAAVVLVACLLAATADASACTPQGVSIAQDSPFPLRTEDGMRYLVDANEKPFFMNGDTAWSLIAQLRKEDAETYLQDRKARGVNTILVNLLEHQFATNAPANIYGDPPFFSGSDFSKPNEAYFKHADWVLQRACDLGFTVLLTPAYVGNGGGSEGWYHEMSENGVDRLRAYGQFLGKRYGHLNNIIWVHGGDYNPPDKDLVRAIVEGIHEFDADALNTAHGAPGSPAIEHWEGEPWLAINNVYTYEPVYWSALTQYEHHRDKPFFLMESAYENEHGANEYRLRMQAYQAVLSGAMGHVFGNNPMWHFDGPGLYAVPSGWKDELDSRGAQSMTYLYNLFSSLRWWELEPDTSNALLFAGHGGDSARAVAARSKDGSFAVIYLPTSRGAIVDLGQLSSAPVKARWFDPSNGMFKTVEESPFDGGDRKLVPPRRNYAGFNDWLLVLETISETGPTR
ncbi:MAG: DUF4038 domain-containing protein [Phyllobacterium sp.]